MILRALYDLAQREGLTEDLDYQVSPVPFALSLGKGGAHPRIMSIDTPPEDGKGRPIARKLTIPRQSGRTSADTAEFLVDKAEYLFGYDPLEKQKPAKLANRHRLYVERVRETREALPEGSLDRQALDAFLAFLALPEAERHAPLRARMEGVGSEAEKKALASGLFVVDFTPAGAYLHELPQVRAHWKRLRSQGEGKATACCLVTGAPCVPVDKHPPIKGVPGGNTAGAALVSFNSPAFESYGLERNENAPISREAAEACAAALNLLLARDPVRPDGARAEVRRYQLSEDSIALFWSREAKSVDWLPDILGDDTSGRVEHLLATPHTGKDAYLQKPQDFCTLVLSGAQGRSLIRAHWVSHTEAVQANLRQYLRDLSLERPYTKTTRPLPMVALLKGLAVQGKLENLPSALASDFYLAAVQGRPFPRSLLEAAVRRTRAEGPSGEAFTARCALIKGVLQRNPRLLQDDSTPFKEIDVSLDTSRTDRGYLLGRVLAIVDKIQTDALGSVNATLVDRYYGAASSTPGVVFPTLLRRVQPHLAKLRKEKRGLQVLHEAALQQALDELKTFPATLPLAEQGLFALGFHHQRQAFYKPKSEAEN